MRWWEGKCKFCGTEFSVPQRMTTKDIIKCPWCHRVVEEKTNLSLPSINGGRREKKRRWEYVNGGAMKLRR